MKKIAAIFFGINLMVGCMNVNGYYSRPWSKTGSRCARVGMGLLGACASQLVYGYYNYVFESDEEYNSIASLINSLLFGGVSGFVPFSLAWWLEWFPQSGNHLNKTLKTARNLTSNEFLERVREADGDYLQYELESLKNRLERESARLLHQIRPEDLSNAQKKKLKHYASVIFSARKHVKNILKAGDSVESKKCLHDFVKEMQQKKESFATGK